MNRYTWPDGTPKSQGNAFDWRGKQSAWANPTTAEKVGITKTLTPSPGKSITVKNRPKTKEAT